MCQTMLASTLEFLLSLFPVDTPQHFAECAEGFLNATRPENQLLVRQRLIQEAHLRFGDAASELEDFFNQWENPAPATP